MKRFEKLFLFLILILVVFTTVSCKKKNNKEQEIDITDLSVRDYVAENGIVAAANPYAAKVGLDILKQGGNAFDAAVAVALAMGVVEMDASGIGGGGLMIAYNVNTKKELFYNFREFASSEVSTNLDDYKEMNGRHCLYTAVPTELAGLKQVLTEQGTLTLKDVLAPSIKLAKEGIVTTPELIANINDNSTKINLNPYLKSTFRSPSGSRLKEGETLVQTHLGNTLEQISENGIEYFYKGAFADKLVETVNNNGGKLTKEDLELAYNKNYLMEETVKGSYKDYDLITVGSPSTGGAMLIEMLNMIEAYGDISSLGHNSKEYINLIATVMQLAYGDKEKYLADKNFVNVPLKGLLNKEYAKERLEKYTPGKAYLGTAVGDTPYGDPSKYNGSMPVNYVPGVQDSHFSTTSFSIVDKEGNMVTITQTINNFFGSGVSVEDSGFFMNDQLKDFSYFEGSINRIEPLKQPASYMLPTVVLKDGKPYATFGTPGGSRIPSAGLQVFLNMTEFNMNMMDAIAAKRVYCFTTNDSNKDDEGKVLYIENGLKTLKDDLTKMGYLVNTYGEQDIHSYFGGVQGIKLENGKYHGAADPRRDGKALGY